MKLEHIIFSRVKILVEGLNLDRVFKLLKNRNIELKQIKKMSYNKLQFFINIAQKKQALEVLQEYNYKITVQAFYGLALIIQFFKERIGILVGTILFIFLSLFLNTFVWKIEVYGLENIQKQQVLEALSNRGIEIGRQIDNSSLKDIELYLESQLEQISMVSVMKKGSTILVNLKEVHIPSVMMDSNNTSPIVSNHDGIITKINVVQGTALVKIGDTVKVGDTLVASYFVNLNGNIVPCNPMAEVYIKIWYSHTVQFDEVKTEWLETGNYVEASYFSLGKSKFNIKTTLPTFDSYKVKTISKYLFSNNLIPIKINKIKYCELTQIIIEQNFDENKEMLEQEVLILAKEKKPSHITSQKEFTTIQKNGSMYLITGYIECEILAHG